ncbi:MAG: Gfo/Idh/MocA family oxidoreductase [Mangrovibacterium sp.]|nr:Gfo/Idh/MocA family oxidoreductase [Mangrovibacterium sp.]
MNHNRREFLKNSAAVVAGVATMPTILTAGCSPNEKITVGLIGARNQGWTNMEAFLKQKNVVCAAICDVDQRVTDKRIADAEKIQGKKPDQYNDFRKLLERKDIDVVINATPDHWHCIPTIYACEAGKDVYVEKPLANTVEEINLMVKATRRYQSVVQVGQWQRSDPHWNDAVDYLHAGNIGRIRSVRAWAYVGYRTSAPVVPDEPAPEGVDYDMWLGPAPSRPFNKNRFHSSFRWYWDYAGGVMCDWGVHMLDFALYGMNEYVPKSVVASGGKYAFPTDDMETPDTMMAIYDFGNFGLLWDHTIGIFGAQYKKRDHGVAFIGEYGTLVVDRSGWEVVPETKSSCRKEGYEGIPVRLSSQKGLDLHVANFLDCIKSRNKPNCDIETGAHIARFANLGNVAYRLGRKLGWDGEKQEFRNDPEANAYLKATYRAPWELPKV